MYPDLTEFLDVLIGPVTKLDPLTGPVTSTAHPAGASAGPVPDRARVAGARISTRTLAAEVRP